MDSQFKLESLLKLKKFKEREEKINLGKILKKIGEKEAKISYLNKSLEKIYMEQSSQMEKGIDGKDLRTYPIMIQSLKDKINEHQGTLQQFKEKCEGCRKNLNTIMGEVKVLQKLKGEHQKKYYKYRNAKREREIEDIINMRKEL